MSLDVNIEKIINVYYCRTDKWKRDFFAPRNFDGIVFFVEGEIEYCFSDKHLIAKKGDFIFLPGNIPYSGKKHCEAVAFFVIDFTCATNEEFENAIHASVAEAKNYNETYTRFTAVIDAWKKQEADMNFKIKSFMYSTLCNAVMNEDKENGASLTDSILDYIFENIGDTTLGVKSLCEKFYISESQLRRNVLKKTGVKPAEYIMRLKMNTAKNELTYTSNSISSIAEKCGFSSAYYFSNCFSGQFGMSPTQYRKSLLLKK